RDRFRELHGLTDMKLSAVLTEGQRRQFQSLQGPPIKFPEFRPRRPKD
ncbi:MAG: hypothetical protein K0Q72_4426, partial [Armatimonadetes bacterium]|nr:hypothetical protein [Armatimonadota bacterium]